MKANNSGNRLILTIITGAILSMFVAQSLLAQTTLEDLKKELESVRKNDESLKHQLDVLQKTIDDVLWFQRVGDVAFIDKVYLAGPPPAKVKNPKAQGAMNPVKFWAYIFIPRDIDASKKYPLIVLPHGGVHGDFTTYYTHIIRELMAQQYIVVAPEYRGSTGYGKSFYELIDYGGLETADSDASRNYMIENYSIVDKDRVGILGWSHGGLIALMSIFDYPEHYKVAFAGVPVSDLVSRLSYIEGYQSYFDADYHIGKTVPEDIEEYRRRSPIWNVHKLQTPLLIHTNTNDEDVHVLEVELLIRALKAEGKKFEYEIFNNIPGGHSFDRMDTRHAKETRMKIYRFLEKQLNPPRKFKSIDDLQKAGYRF